MARSYKVKPDQLEPIHIYVDTRGGQLRVLHDINLYRKVVGETEEMPLFCFDESKYPDGLPEGVYKETAYFAPLTFAVSEEIDGESLKYEENPQNPNQPLVRIDLTKRTELRIKYLLRRWTLSDADEELILSTYKDPNGKIYLTNESLSLVNHQVEPKIIRGFMQAYDFNTRAVSEQIEEEAVDEIKKGSGGRLNVKN